MNAILEAPSAVSAPKAGITPEEWLEMPAAMRDGYDLIDGQLVEWNVSQKSSRAGARFAQRIGNYADAHNSGWAFAMDLGYRIFEGSTVRHADASFISLKRMPSEGFEDSGYCEVAPEVVVEAVSPNDLAYDVDAKVREWLKAGAVVVWTVYPESRTVNENRRRASRDYQSGETITAPDVMPGFELAVDDLFRLPGQP